MFAVIKTGSKQYKVAKDDVIIVEKLPGEKGAQVTLSDVLMVGGEGAARIGKPMIAGASVTAELVDQILGDKVIIFKKRRRQHYRRKRGHRQPLTVLRIQTINAGA